MNIEQIISDMTVEEKIRLLAGESFWATEAVERLGVPSVVVTDGPHGVRLTDMETQHTKPATAFPNEAAMAATWNEELIRDAGRVMAEECQYFGVGVLLGPGLNGKRSPLGGRNFEYFSEDPYLTGKMGTAFVQGVQSGGVGTSIKHFVANEQEKNRMVVSSEVDERTLREIYMLPFEMVVKEAEPWTVMCSYNKVNGVQMGNNDAYLNGVLKREWGFEGLVMSDWGAVIDKLASVQYGLDLEMPGPGHRNGEVFEAYKNGLVTDDQLNDHVRRILNVVKRVIEQKREVPSVDLGQHHTIARSVAEESLVLLKNESQLLPLPKQVKVAVLGKFAEAPRFQGGGSSHMNPAQLDIPLEAISKFAEVQYRAGYEDESVSEALLQEAVEAAKGQDAVILFVGTTDRIESEGYDRMDLSLPESHLRLIEAVSAVNPNVIVVNHSGSAVDFERFEPKARAILHAWLPGQAGGTAIANVLFGDSNPSGRLSETFPVALEHNPSYVSFPGDIRQVAYSEGIFVGYRHYDTRKLPVKYEFGYGLSYTKFEYSNLVLSQASLTNGDVLQVKVDVTNTGTRVGKEVVQVYVQDVKSSVPKALRELKGFCKVELAAGETKTVLIELGERAFAHYAEHLGRFAVESGEFVIGVGASSRNIRLTGKVNFASQEEVREPLTLLHDLKDWLEDDRYADRIKPIFAKMNVESSSPFFPIMIGMPMRTAAAFLPFFGVSPEVVKELHEAIGLAESRNG
ncbi:glycoside hydrolase family 3 C-terminal domain-containing protein [Paenibacillus abyssi]|uniref:Glycosyl hydrolase n=1 Tax=Paenibacillus abyssi TaxID=1340531 RepID=A0A917G4M9_9BACL|nr:glycoside hydrolase family 3 C-terminal domain-containing protein [Paenibacillus abyssi]GGG22623.1 glycosyl hydrolase [Paenibacillus abyssi]